MSSNSGHGQAVQLSVIFQFNLIFVKTRLEINSAKIVYCVSNGILTRFSGKKILEIYVSPYKIGRYPEASKKMAWNAVGSRSSNFF